MVGPYCSSSLIAGANNAHAIVCAAGRSSLLFVFLVPFFPLDYLDMYSRIVVYFVEVLEVN